MAKYLVRGNYTPEGLKGLMKDGGSGRRAAVEKAMASVGGSVDPFYFAFGENDLVAILEVPDDATAAALSLAVGAAGGADANLTVLIAPETLDQAASKTAAYRAPGA